jgi:hypothetical protein
MRRHSQNAIKAQKIKQEYEELRAFNPDLPAGKSPDDYNALRALSNILSWLIFKHGAAGEFTGLMKERILQPLGLKLEVPRIS